MTYEEYRSWLEQKSEISPKITHLPSDTPERMVEIFKSQYDTSSPEMKKVLNELIKKWDGWHGYVFRNIYFNGCVGKNKISNWNEIYQEVVKC